MRGLPEMSAADRAIVEREMPCSRACDAPPHSDFCRQRREAGLRIAAAIREEGRREGMEEAAKAQCDGCRDGLRYDVEVGTHQDGGVWSFCMAVGIRARIGGA